MEDICDILIETYNVNKFDNAEKELKDALYKEANDCTDTHPMKIYAKKGETTPIRENERTILKKLIRNHFDPTIHQPMPKFIAGPTTLTVHKSPDEKRMIYIFGEWHTDIKDCSMFEDAMKKKWNEENPDKMTIDYFFYELMKTTPAYLDILVEFPAFTREHSGYYPLFKFGLPNYHMYNLFQKFKKCINTSESRSYDDCELARVHYFDSRSIEREGSLKGITDVDNFVETFFKLQNMYGENSFLLITQCIKLVKNEKVISILNSLSSSDEQEFSKFWLKQMNDNRLNIKETKSEKFQESGTIELIKRFMETEIIKIAMSYRKLYIEAVEKIFKESKSGGDINIFYDAFDELISYIMETSASVADIYLLARVFKDFDMSKMTTHANKRLTDQPNKAYNIIIYAGNTHAEIYRRFLKEVAGFEEIASTGKSELDEGETRKYCIDMKTIPQPFFSTWTRTPTEE